MARGMARGMSEEERLFFENNYPLMSVPEFCAKFEDKFGRYLSATHMHRLVKKFGIDKTPPGYFSIREVAELTGLTRHAIYSMVTRKTLFSRRFGNGIYIPMTSAHPLIEHYCTIPTYEVERSFDAAVLIGYSVHYRGASNPFSRAWVKGHIDGYKYKGNLYIKKKHVDAACRQIKKTGFTKVFWTRIRKECGE